MVLSIVAIVTGANPAAAATVSDGSRVAFIVSVGEFLGLQTAIVPVFSASRPTLTGVPVSLPNINPLPGVVIIPITTGDVTGLGAISYDLQITFDPAVVTPASPAIDKTGTISSGMSVTPNSGFPGHLIVTAFQGTPLSGSGTLLFLRFNVIGAPGQSTAFTFENFVDPGSNNHPGFRYNEGIPASKATNGSISVMATPTATATVTNTSTPTFTPTSTATNTPTATPTNSPTNTATSTSTNTSTPTFTPTNTATNTPTFTPTSAGTPSAVPVSLPHVSPFQGVITVPVTTGNVTGLNVISYDFQVSFDPAVVTPASPPFDRTGTLSSSMLVTSNDGFPGHLIITGFQATPVAGSGLLLNLRFNVIGAPGQSTGLIFENYIDPNTAFHPAFTYNEGDPPTSTTSGSVMILATPTATSTATNTATATNTPTNTATSTATNTPTNTPTDTPTPTSTATPTNTATDTPTATHTATDTPTATNTSTATPTPTAPPFINGTVSYGNAVGTPSPRFVSNVLMTADGLPSASAVTDAPGATEGQYSLGIFGLGSYIVTPSKTGGTNNAINSFDAGRIAQHVTGISILSGNQVVVADVSGNGLIQSFDAGLIARFVTQSGTFGSTGTWRFLPVNRTYLSVVGDLTGEDYTALLMGEVSGNWQNTGARPVDSWQLAAAVGVDEGSIAVDLPRVAASIGDEIVVPVTVAGVANKGIISYEFNLIYDPSVVQPMSDAVSLVSTVSRGLTFVANAAEPGILRVAVYGPLPIDADGILFNLRFKAVGETGSVSPLIWEKLFFNDGEMRAVSANGRVEIIEN